LGQDSKDDEEYYDMAAAICRKMIKRNPANKVAKERLALIYYNLTSSYFLKEYYFNLAYKIVEELLMEDPQNGVGIVLMCRKYYSSEDWEDLLKLGKKGYELG
jgi:tetratricopeptide (TPR) repeat protein